MIQFSASYKQHKFKQMALHFTKEMSFSSSFQQHSPTRATKEIYKFEERGLRNLVAQVMQEINMTLQMQRNMSTELACECTNVHACTPITDMNNSIQYYYITITDNIISTLPYNTRKQETTF